uniref:AAA+ ATPase domain-containing protein n=1 Tax=Hildenbrandia rivularis TaxID=135206 RepID=A0A1C9CFD5_9FLOR|nr:hypothetical protein Hrvl_009 [Hildenbrandia rivularis]AOM67069.1 hypothetical protein Hrvl_009 [Hildenbrandia rivularis]
MLIADDLSKLLEVLPNFIKTVLEEHGDSERLLEIVMDLGRRPEARFADASQYLSKKIISWQDLDYCVKRIGDFSGDNRSGIEKTLHRISSIRNRKGSIVGLTCRVGRALFGTIGIIRDLLKKQQSILILGKPGIGKTTAIREIARVLSDEMHKRVIVIDTSNEIAGDGDIPHLAIGGARRMQVTLPELQHQIMIEAVENHMPQVIIIDEISTELEVLAARTIAERGVQLIGTVHGNFLDSLIKNPVLCDLIGGIQYVTLGDDEARRRGTQKSILERKTSPAFQVVVEIHGRQNLVIHEKVDVTIDQILQGCQSPIQYRSVLHNGKLAIYNKNLLTSSLNNYSPDFNVSTKKTTIYTAKHFLSKKTSVSELLSIQSSLKCNKMLQKLPTFTIANNIRSIILHVYLISSVEINKVIKALQLPLVISKDINTADAVLALRCHVKHNAQLRRIARSRQIVIYSIHSDTIPQITRVLKRITNSKVKNLIDWEKIFCHRTKAEIEALEEAQAAIENILMLKKQPVQLLPRVPSIRELQRMLVNIYNFTTRTFGEEPCCCLRIYLT